MFRVKASNNDGVWNEQGANVALRVLPAPWFSWWAYTIYTLIFILIILLMYRSYKRKLMQQELYQHELEREVEKRTAELKEVNERLLNASITDQLTGLHNRRYLAEIIEQRSAATLREFTDAKRNGGVSPVNGPRLFFLMFDLDGFKPINDNYGHDAGDKVIAQVAGLLTEASRSADTIIRWGGDEFLMIGQVKAQSEVEVLAERVRERIASYGFDIGLKQKVYLSSSIGFACYPFASECPEALSWEQVHTIADSALYMSKDAGRNCWSGLTEGPVKPPASEVNSLSHSIDSALENSYIIVRQGSPDNHPE